MKQFVLSAFIFVLSTLFNINECWAGDLSLAPAAARKTYIARSSSTAKAFISVTSFGRDVVNSFEYTITSDKGTVVEGTYTFKEAFRKYDTSTCEIEFPVNKVTDITSLTFSIDKVNNERNGATLGSCNIPFTFISKFATRKVVVEDFTGMWCGWCPRALASLENAVHKYANNIIPIAIHGGGSGEPLYCSTYYNKLKQLTGYPTLEINRRAQSNKYLLDTYIDNDLAKLTTVEVNVSAMWNEEKTDINVSSETIFRVAQDPVNYSLAYVITEDSLSDPNWRQANYLSGRNQYKGFFPELDKMVDSEHSIANMVFRHTAIAAAGILSGFPSSVKPTVVVDEVQKHQHVFRNMAQYSTWKNKEHLDIIVLLLNNATGEIVNANISRVKLNATTGIQQVANATENAREVARYDAWGRYISAPVKGLNLIKYSNGNVEKVWIK